MGHQDMGEVELQQGGGASAASAWPARGSRSGPARAPAMQRLGRPLALAAALGLASAYALALFDFGDEARQGEIRDGLYLALMVGAATAAVIGAVIAREKRLTWGLIAAGLGAWALGDIYWADVAQGFGEYPWVSHVFFLGFYVASTIAIAALLSRAEGAPALSLGLFVGLLGLTTFWAALLFGNGVGDGRSLSAGVEIAYPLLDAALLAATLVTWATVGWGRQPALAALAAGFSVTLIADVAHATQALSGAGAGRGVIDVLWPTAVILIASASWWSRSAAPVRPLRAEGLSLWLALTAGAVALVVLIWDHYDRLAELTVILAAVTVLAALALVFVLYRERTRAEDEVRAAIGRSVQALALAVDIKDEQTHAHSDRVGQITAAIAREMDVAEERLERLLLAGRLHDLGKVMIPEEILCKPGPLTPVEYERIKRHPADGGRILEAVGLEDVAAWIRHHHERWDGAGYPDRLAGEEIPLESRIIGAADAFDAMTSDRPYRSAMPVDDAIAEFRSGRGRQFDPAIVEAVIVVSGSLRAESGSGSGDYRLRLRPS